MRSAAAIYGIIVSSLLVGPAAASAQHIPGGGARDLRERSARLAIEYRREVLADLSRLMLDWQAAWEADDAPTLIEMYSQNGVIIRPSERAAYRGREEIEGFFVDLLSTAGTISTDILDLDAADRMAYVVARYTSSPSQGVGGEIMRGTLVTVVQLEGSTWRIRSQTFLDGS
jgi:ketosteroid isomerase-like protein